MTGLIVDIKDKDCFVMDNNGIIHKVKNLPHYSVGQIIDYSEKPNIVFLNSMAVRYASIAAVFLFALVSVFIYNTAVSSNLCYMDVEINPSIFLTIDKGFNVKSIKGQNDDGKKIVNEMDIKNKDINAALTQIFQTASDLGYIKEENASAAIAVTSPELEKYIASSEFYAMSSDIFGDIELMALEKIDWDKSIKNNISPAKYALINDLSKDTELTPEDLKKLDSLNVASIGDIKKFFEDSNFVDIIDEPLPAGAATTSSYYTDKPEVTPVPAVAQTQEPTQTPETTPEPTQTPKIDVTTEPTIESTAEPTAKPTQTPKPEPTAEPTTEPAAKPTQTPKPTAKPTERPKPEATAKPTKTPKPEKTPKPDNPNKGPGNNSGK